VRRLAILLVLLGGFTGAPLVVADANRDTLDRRIAGLLDHLPHARTQVSAMVVDAESGSVLYQRNANVVLTPASNQKLLVLASGADFLADHDVSFVTRFAIRGDDLMIIGDGDPGLGDRSLAESRGQQPLDFVAAWAAAAKHNGMTTADALIVDASVLDQQFVHPDWEQSDLLKWYGAPVGGLNLNDNCVEITVWPDSQSGAAAIWSLFPPCPLAKVENRCKSMPGGSRKDNEPVIGRRLDSFELVLSGTVSERGTLQSIPVVQPNLFAACAIREELARLGVTVRGDIRFERVADAQGRLPESVRVIAEARTPLTDVMARIGHDSQNMFAEALAKRLGYEHDLAHFVKQPIGSWDSARRALTETLTQAGVDASRAHIADASGLSRENRLSASDMVALLRFMLRHPKRDLFLESLAGNETGGRLQSIFASVDGEIFAKTGYMRGIRSLSGLVRSAGGRWYAFSIIFNGFRGPSTPYFRIQQNVARMLADEG